MPDLFSHAENMASPRIYEFVDYVLNFHHDQIQETGLWRSPIGLVYLFITTGDMAAAYVSFAGDPWASLKRNLPAGVYIVHKVSGQSPDVYYYGTDLPGNMAAAQMDFDEADRTFEQWAGGQGL